MIFAVEPVIQVLLTSTFNNQDLNNKMISFNQIKEEYVKRRLVAVHAKPTIVGDRCIDAKSRADGEKIDMNTYIILIPIIIPQQKLSPMTGKYVDGDDLQYIINKVIEIASEEVQVSVYNITLNYYIPLCFKPSSLDDDSSSDDDIPISRGFFITESDNKYQSILQWIDKCKL